MEFQNILEILWRRRSTFFGVFAVFFLTVVLVTFLAKPVYRATVKILVETGSDPQTAVLGSLGLKTAGGLNTNTSTNTSSSGDYDTDIELARTRPLLERLVETLHLKARNGAPLQPERLIKLGFLRKTILPQPYINVDQYEDAMMVKIEAYSSDPNEALKMSNLLAEYYQKDRIERTKEEFKSARKLVESRIQQVKTDYQLKLSASEAYKMKEAVVDIDKETSAIVTKISTLLTSKEENEKSIIEYDKRLALDREKMKELKPLRNDVQEFIQSQESTAIQSKLSDLVLNLASKSADITKEHPDYIALEKQIDAAKDVMKSDIHLVLNTEKYDPDPAYDDLYKKTYTDYIEKEAAIAKRAIMQKYIRDYQKQFMTYPAKTNVMSQLDADSAVLKDTYAKLLGVMTQLTVAEAIAMTNTNIVEYAALPQETYFPKKSINYLIGFVLGLLIALGAVFFVDYADTTIKTLEDIDRMKYMTPIGAIPFTKLIKSSKVIPGLPPASAEVDAFRAVRNGIGFELATKAVKSIAVTSSFELEGRSTVAANISILFADDNRRVLLADMNVLNPALHTFFDFDNSTGITDVLAGGAELKSVIRSTPIKGLDVLPCGPLPTDPGRIVESARLKDMISELEGMYDLVVIETPPIMTFNNSVIIGKIAGGVLHVVESGRVSFAVFDRIKYLMNKAGINVIGAVVNKEDVVAYERALSSVWEKTKDLMTRSRTKSNSTGVYTRK